MVKDIPKGVPIEIAFLRPEEQKEWLEIIDLKKNDKFDDFNLSLLWLHGNQTAKFLWMQRQGMLDALLWEVRRTIG